MKDPLVFITVLILFPAFGAAVFFWWRKKAGIWSKRDRERAAGEQTTQVIDDAGFGKPRT